MIFVFILSLLCWLGQLISVINPTLASRWGLIEQKNDVDPVFYADALAEACLDSFTLWILPLSTIFYIFDLSIWSVFGIIGGSLYFYVSLRIIFTRFLMKKGIKLVLNLI